MGPPKTAVVVGGGCVGTACAYELLRAGYEVTLVEKCKGVAQVGSYQNGNHIAADWRPVMATKAFPREFALGLWGDGHFLPWETSLRHTLLSPPFLRWLVHFASALTREEALQKAGTALSSLAKGCFDDMAERYKELRDIPRYGPTLKLGNWEGQREGVMDARVLREKEPRLPVGDGVVGWELVGSESMDCRGYTTALATLCQARYGMSLRTGVEVEHVGTRKVVLASGETLTPDVVVVSAGVATPSLLPSASLPITAVGGYSLLWHDVQLLSTYHKIYLFSGMGLMQGSDGVRLSGLVHFSYPGVQHPPQHVRRVLLDRVERRLGRLEGFGEGKVTAWTCYRPTSPDTLPIIGQVADGVYVCSGHSFNGWAWSLPSARLLLHAVDPSFPAPCDPTPYLPQRFWFT